MFIPNKEQKRAIDTISGPILIVAGAGSGKTGVITHRIFNLIQRDVAPESILAITFTNKSAKKMRERVMRLISDDGSTGSSSKHQTKPFVSTFHALGVHIIRENAKLLGLDRHFSIYDRADSRRAVKEAMTMASIDLKQFDPNLILNIISKTKGEGLNCTTYRENAIGYMADVVSNVWDRYEKILAKEKSLDFDDLLLKTMNLLGERKDIRDRYGSTWKYIHVDEYQDTNQVQYKIMKYLAEKHHNICAVGDVDQNIYSWRGATIENIMNFEKDYPDATVIVLDKNYRSTKTILEVANSVIEKNIMRKKKVLHTDNDQGEKVSLTFAYDEHEEARVIAEKINELLESGVSAREIAVLYRTNFQSRVLEELFIKKNIPYQLLGVRFFERKEVKDILSYIRASLNLKNDKNSNPDNRNIESWGDISRIINVPPRGIGKVSLSKITSNQENLLPPATRTKVGAFWKLLSDIQRQIIEKNPSDVIRFIIKETGIEKSLQGGRGDDEERLLNIQELVTVASQYDHIKMSLPAEATETEKLAGIEALLTNSALASDQDELKEDVDAVRLMTVHSAKGLEFDHVFISGLEQGLFPLKHMDNSKSKHSEEEEERRLFYVALTRAKKKVHLSYSFTRTIYGTQRSNAPSEFINDIDKDLIEDVITDKPTGIKAIFIDF